MVQRKHFLSIDWWRHRLSSAWRSWSDDCCRVPLHVDTSKITHVTVSCTMYLLWVWLAVLSSSLMTFYCSWDWIQSTFLCFLKDTCTSYSKLALLKLLTINYLQLPSSDSWLMNPYPRSHLLIPGCEQKLTIHKRVTWRLADSIAPNFWKKEKNYFM